MTTHSRSYSSGSNAGVLVLAGVTASGKTALATALARRFNAEIIGADSRQIYRGMTIGTAAPTPRERAAAPHHLIEIIEPGERYSAAQFSYDALARINDIHARGKRAIVAGGTGFYVRALTGAVALCPPGEPEVRERLTIESRLHDAAFLHDWFSLRDRARAALIAPQDRYRVLRGLEIALMRGPSRPSPRAVSLLTAGIPFAKAFIDVDDRLLEQRIEGRVDAMLAAGFIEEAERVGAQAVAASAVGYLQALAYLRGWSTFSELRKNIIRATLRYAKRQRTWFRSEPQTIWLRGDNLLCDIEKLAREKLGWA